MKRVIFILIIFLEALFAFKGFSQVKMNPQIGLNGLLLYTNTSDSSEKEEDGFSLQEAELLLTSDIDHLLRAQVVLGLHPKHEHDDDPSGHSHEQHGFDVDPEEAFVETLSLPHLTLRAGKFYSIFGKNNRLHTHALPFIKRNHLINTVFGEEGYTDTGVRVSGSIPFSWFSELHFEVLDGNNEELFEEKGHSHSYIVRFNNLWDLSRSTTLELGTSGLFYEGEASDETDIYGVDLTLKWRPTEKSRYTSFEWSSEFIKKNATVTGSLVEVSGIMSHLRYQFSQRWWLQYRYEYLALNATEDINTVLIAYVPSEFSALRLQYDRVHDRSSDETENTIMLQLNFSIGAHPAHSY